jgi:hypothetical protein
MGVILSGVRAFSSQFVFGPAPCICKYRAGIPEIQLRCPSAGLYRAASARTIVRNID